MKKYTIISTYPREGSKNVGDALITKATIENIRNVKASEKIDFNVVWREAEWNSVKDCILNSDVIIFACLAVRDNMAEKEYPYINNILEYNVPIAVLAAGTSLNFGRNGYYQSFSNATKELLNKLNERAIFFSTRGVLSDWILKEQGIDNCKMAGDIAFCEKSFYRNPFKEIGKVERIILSDPHRPKRFLPLFKQLFNQLKKLFPKAKLTVGIHGKNRTIIDFCKEHDIDSILLYKQGEKGLEKYENFDLHVGFRVHGHVNMLKRRKPSYLIEQDGRGVDYGLTLNRSISVPTQFYFPILSELKSILLQSLRIEKNVKNYPTVNTVTRLMAIIYKDFTIGKNKFIGLEKQIDKFSDMNKELLELLP